MDLEFEKKKHNDEVRLREAEIELRRLELESTRKGIFHRPAGVALIAGLFTIVGAVLTAFQGYTSNQLEMARSSEQIALEAAKSENILIQKFIDMAPNRKITIANLRFMAEAGLLTEEKSKKVNAYLKNVEDGYIINMVAE